MKVSVFCTNHTRSGHKKCMFFPGFAVYYMFTQKGTFKERLTRGITPNIKSLARVNAPSKKDLKLSESSAKLIRNASSAANVGDQVIISGFC